jgi:hypothetical protein
MKILLNISILLLFAVFGYKNNLHAQKSATKNVVKQRGATDFPELIIADIAGAPTLSKPELIMGTTGPVMSEGMGWASPAVLDWDGDGKKDLLIGEFGSGSENKKAVGNFLRVYLNEGLDSKPAFSDIFNYAWGYSETSGGTPLSIYTWCCMAFTPRIADLNSDGYPDILSGQFEPGNVTWFKGSKDGYMPGQVLDQSGDPLKLIQNRTDYKKDPTDITGHPYWMYSSAAFGDFDKDGDQDMIIGGSSLRISENIGTRTDPVFGHRKRLLDTDEKPLKVFSHIPGRWENYYDSIGLPELKPESGSGVCVPYVVDWDNDGMLDILVTHAYVSEGDALITLFRGVKVAKGIRFEKGVPLITTKNNEKAFPGTNPNIAVADWNNDGIQDLLVGVNVATLNGKFFPTIAWDWEGNHGTYKLSPADYSPEFLRIINKQMAFEKAYQDSTKLSTAELRKLNRGNVEDSFKHYFVKEEYKSLSHKGYVYVMLGKKKD